MFVTFTVVLGVTLSVPAGK